MSPSRLVSEAEGTHAVSAARTHYISAEQCGSEFCASHWGLSPLSNRPPTARIVKQLSLWATSSSVADEGTFASKLFMSLLTTNCLLNVSQDFAARAQRRRTSSEKRGRAEILVTADGLVTVAVKDRSHGLPELMLCSSSCWNFAVWS